MNRTIKFRGKRIDNGEWVYGSYVTHNTYSDDQIIEGGVAYDIIPESIGQFIEQLDEDGKEIYDGDFLHSNLDHRWFDWLVIIIDGIPHLINIGVDGYQHLPEVLRKQSSNMRFVIGNLIDNPELLKP